MLRARTSGTMVTPATSSTLRTPAVQNGPSSRRTRSYSHLDFGTEGLDDYLDKARSSSLRKSSNAKWAPLSLLSSLGFSGRSRRSRLVALKCAVVVFMVLAALVVLRRFNEVGEAKSAPITRPTATRKAHRSGASHRPPPPKHARKTDFFEEWLHFQGDHPHNATDRFAFAEMGFQTAVYEQAMLSVHELGEQRLEEIELKLYPWMRNLDVLRKSHVFKHKDDAASKMDPTHHRPTNPGIVIVAGDGQFRYAVELINTIRKGHHCDMPIEVFYFGSEDLSTERQDFLSDNFEGVRPVDLSLVGFFDESFADLKHGGWAMKPYAMMASNFTEVMVLDADSVLLADPHDFFHQPDYRRTGTYFFQDRLASNEHYEALHTWFKAQLGLRGPSPELSVSPFWEKGLRYRGESGLVMLNKADPGVFAALLFILWQNSGAIREEATYVVFYGDKETFWSAFEMAGIPYYMSPYWAGAIGPEHAKHLDGFCSDHILHFFDAPVVHNASSSTGFGHGHKQKPRTHHSSNAERTKDIEDDMNGDMEDEEVGVAAKAEATDFVEDDVAAAHESAPLRIVTARPAWLNGALRNNKLWDADEGVMDYATSIWTMDGEWDWRQVPAGGSSFCKVNYTRHSLDDLGTGPVMRQILQAGEEADIMILEYLEGGS